MSTVMFVWLLVVAHPSDATGHFRSDYIAYVSADDCNAAHQKNIVDHPGDNQWCVRIPVLPEGTKP